jgi:hypothetical protein
VVILSLVLFLALPLAVLITIDHLRMKSQMQAEVRRMGELRKQLKDEVRKEVEDVANRRGDRSEPNQ